MGVPPGGLQHVPAPCPLVRCLKIVHPKVVYNPRDFYVTLQVNDIERALLNEYSVRPTVYCLPVKVRTATLS